MKNKQRNAYRLLLGIVALISLFAFKSTLADTTTTIQNGALQNITIQGSLNGGAFKQLGSKEFIDLKTTDSLNMGTWLGLVTHLDTADPQVHIVDKDFYGDVRRLGFRVRYGIHEGYARKHGFAANSEDFFAKVIGKSSPRKLMPFTLHIPFHKKIETDDINVNWVFQNRRYKYKDSTSSFTQSLIKSQQAVTKHLFADFSHFKSAFLTYNLRGTRRPNLLTSQGRKDIRALKSANFAIITERELDKVAGIEPKQLYIMNEGAGKEGNHPVSYGILRHISNLEELPVDPSGINESLTADEHIDSLVPKDIAIFDALPERIPPVAGIIVLEKQTALSHVNILAKNRGTMNISLHSLDPNKSSNTPEFIAEQIRGFSTDLYDKPVRLSIQNGKLEIQTSTLDAVNTYHADMQASRPHLEIEAPLIVDAQRWLLNPANEGLKVNQVGAKAANYGLIQIWLKPTGLVMPGRAIGFNLYLQTVKIEGDKGKPADLIAQLIADKDNLSNPEINQHLVKIQEAIQVIPFKKMPVNAGGKTLLEELRTLLDSTYNNVGRIRFRSSTNAEDLPTFNGAGLYESQGFNVNKLDDTGKRIINKKKMWKKLKTVLASLWLPRAFHEREFFGIDHSKVAMAIQINPAFSDQWMNGLDLYEWGSGVVLYGEKGGKKTFQVNSQFGEASVTNPLPGELPESLLIINGELSEVKRRSNINNVSYEIFVSRENDEIKVAEKPLLEQLQAGVKIIFDNKILQNPNSDFSSPEKFGIDIEFKIMLDNDSGRKALFIKQARPLQLELL